MLFAADDLEEEEEEEEVDEAAEEDEDEDDKRGNGAPERLLKLLRYSPRLLVISCLAL